MRGSTGAEALLRVLTAPRAIGKSVARALASSAPNLHLRTASGAAWQNNDTSPEKRVTLRIRLDTLATITKGAGRCDFCGLVLGGRDFRRGSCRSPDQRHRSEIQTRDFGCKAKALHFFCLATACPICRRIFASRSGRNIRLPVSPPERATRPVAWRSQRQHRRAAASSASDHPG